ncbi:phage/plasmid-like protein (TIGR03299 family) [Haloactinopolyspora alba]|uniref:Phage/plasmid-like protein (TIGR03299 family) n=1 Tax=Haloactinopolyspora alba TaxID=648780 RepID=A0A2P8DF29_9ACTN|nr:DUF932 domain-containing protein [Haloactinopolyspora alba]PSK95836.1 phage/plasmid-like protein (TIGR03299 family) [Haloactinopolyspora alba]
MAHELDINNGVASFASARQHAWHRLGTVLEDVFTAEEAMKHANLGGWNVRKTPLTTTVLGDEGVSTIEIPDRYATVRTNPVTGQPDYLGGVVADGYQIIQNEEHAELLNALVDEGGAHFETAGALRGGRQVFLSMKLPQGITVGGVDDIETYIVALNSHDGRQAFRLLVTPVRVVCANTQAAALSDAKATYTVRHTANAQKAILEAREALGVAFDYMDDFATEAERMINTSMAEGEFVEFTEKVFGKVTDDTGKRAARTATQRNAELLRLFNDADTNAKIRGTRWGAYQAVTEYIDHLAPVKGKGDAADIRAMRTATGDTARQAKEFAFAAL